MRKKYLIFLFLLTLLVGCGNQNTASYSYSSGEPVFQVGKEKVPFPAERNNPEFMGRLYYEISEYNGLVYVYYYSRRGLTVSIANKDSWLVKDKLIDDQLTGIVGLKADKDELMFSKEPELDTVYFKINDKGEVLNRKVIPFSNYLGFNTTKSSKGLTEYSLKEDGDNYKAVFTTPDGIYDFTLKKEFIFEYIDFDSKIAFVKSRSNNGSGYTIINLETGKPVYNEDGSQKTVKINPQYSTRLFPNPQNDGFVILTDFHNGQWALESYDLNVDKLAESKIEGINSRDNESLIFTTMTEEEIHMWKFDYFEDDISLNMYRIIKSK